VAGESPGRRRGAATEFFVIVVGVLVALWIDAGWQWLRDRSEERRPKADLVQEFRQNLAELEGIQEEDRDRMAQIRAALDTGIDEIPADSVLPTLWATLYGRTFNPKRGALEAATSAANLHVFRSPELRNALSGWDGYLEDAQEEMEWMVTGTLKLYEQVASKAFPLIRRPESPTNADKEAARAVLRRIYSDESLRNLVVIRAALIDEGGQDRAALIAETRRIIELAGGTP